MPAVSLVMHICSYEAVANVAIFDHGIAAWKGLPMDNYNLRRIKPLLRCTLQTMTTLLNVTLKASAALLQLRCMAKTIY